jgi:hypothetical protein
MSAKLGLFSTVLKQLPTTITATLLALGAAERESLVAT